VYAFETRNNNIEGSPVLQKHPPRMAGFTLKVVQGRWQ
jgi:hypothetical protein